MPLFQPGGRRALDKILGEDYVVGIEVLPLAEVRHMRLVVDHEEAWLSYLRRMLHARIDILDAQGDVAGSPSSAAAAAVAELAQRLGTGLPDEGAYDPGRREVEKVIDRAARDADAQSEGRRLDQMRAMEREVSDLRHQVHRVHGILTQELARRYREGPSQKGTT